MKRWMLLGLLCSATAMADNSNTSYGARDPAKIKCFQFLTMLERSPRGSEQQFYSWMQGYFAGRRLTDPDLYKLPDDGIERDKIFHQIVAHCENKPESTYADAVEVFVNSKT
jgi:hypothetical protein